jgi:hypothetical protein
VYAEIAPSAAYSAELYQQAAVARAEVTRRSCAVSLYALVIGTAALPDDTIEATAVVHPNGSSDVRDAARC